MSLILGLLASLTLALLYLSGWLPGWLALLLGLFSTLSLLAYGIDKAAAKAGSWRIPENWLHLLALAGGWPGALLAQALFRHKTSKWRFLLVSGLCALLNLAVLIWFLFARVRTGL